MMKKLLLLSVIIALSVNALFSAPTEFTGYGDEKSPARTQIHFVYNEKIERIGFTDKALGTSSYDVPVEIREINLSPNPSARKATSVEFYAYWQINNKNDAYEIYLSSTGLKKDDASAGGCNWSVSAGDGVGFINQDVNKKLLHSKKANTTKEGIGSQKLVVTIENYHLLKAGNYILPLKLELVTL